MSQIIKIPQNITSATKTFAPNDDIWKKELANANTSTHDLLKKLHLEAYLDIADEQPTFRCLVTESYIQKMQLGNINDPLLQQVLPLNKENQAQTQNAGVTDPVGDIRAISSPGLLHKYHGRALLISTGACAIHCRYCFRRHYPYQQSSCTTKVLDETLAYLHLHTEIDEIILSGGDPLVLDNSKLEKIIRQLETIEHIQTLRIHTRIPVVLASRINNDLLQLLQSCRFDVVMVIHANHANELQKAEHSKLHLLHAAGITLLNQSVLLKGVNDNAETLITLSKRLFQCKTLPYYLHLLDPVTGAMHFDINKQSALKFKIQMERYLPGYLVPKLVQEITGKQAKTAIFRI
ncbi:Lysine 2,3-aminomutase [hydrothermal vent metagenome]|uniref:L-lysine 2,3-aminomutase n=1 Tax=hydrothermal vent metagenome TaxID=652676 RepID=A0A3B0W5T3_9ZZZZ